MDLVPWFPGARKCHACYQRINIILSLIQLWTLWAPIRIHLARQAHRCNSIMDAMEVSNHFPIGSEPHPMSWNLYMEHRQCQEPMVKVQRCQRRSFYYYPDKWHSIKPTSKVLPLCSHINSSLNHHQRVFLLQETMINTETPIHKGTENENERRGCSILNRTSTSYPILLRFRDLQ